MKPTPQQSQRLTKARVQLLLDHPFFGTLATRLENVIDDKVKTTATDGQSLFWNSGYLMGLQPEEVQGVIGQAVGHSANGHTWRRGDRDKKAWNQAADKTINGILSAAGLVLPKGELIPTPSEVNQAVECLYTAPAESPDGKSPQAGGETDPNGGQGQNNPANQQKDSSKPGTGQPQPGPADKPGCCEVLDAPAEEATELEAEWKVAVAQAAESAKAEGKLPGELQRMIDEIVNPKVSWETLLRDFVQRSARNDFNWTRPNRRYAHTGILLPSLISDELPEIVVVVDTSGSIGKKQLDQFASEVSAVLGCYETTIRLVYADARVAHTEVITRADLPLKLSAFGGGGTDFRPAFDWVTKQDLTPACLIYLTDLYGPTPTQEPDYPVLWICTTDRVAPIGETVKMEGV